jgi:hypothetical protein
VLYVDDSLFPCDLLSGDLYPLVFSLPVVFTFLFLHSVTSLFSVTFLISLSYGGVVSLSLRGLCVSLSNLTVLG